MKARLAKHQFKQISKAKPNNYREPMSSLEPWSGIFQALCTSLDSSKVVFIIKLTVCIC
jgi:hypothetical protein